MKAIIAAPALGLMIYRAHSKKSLTTGGLVAATLTGIAHAIHPWNLPFVLLCVFFLAGTRVTHIKQGVKATLTMSSKGGASTGEGPRTHVQVFANSIVASALSLLHAHQLRARAANPAAGPARCFAWGGDVLVIGIIAHYAAVAADTFASELGILARGAPRLLTSPTLRRVPPGTNGGVTLTGLGAGLLGSMVVVAAAVLFVPFCAGAGAGRPWTPQEKLVLAAGLTVWGALGSVLDSVLGGLLQRSVRDARTGRIVEGAGGKKVLVGPSPSKGEKSGGSAAVDGSRDKQQKPNFGRVVESGWDILDNNDVNFLMALTMSLGSMIVAGWYWGHTWDTIFASS